MKKQRGFTLVELILALLLSAIMAGVIIEIIAGPIRAYFWVSSRTLLFEDGALALENMQSELNAAWLSTLQIDDGAQPEIVFHKIVDEGFKIQNNKVQHFYVLSDEIRYQCDNNGWLTRISNSKTSRLTNQIKKCEFTRHDTTKGALLLLKLEMGKKIKEPISLMAPVLLEAKS